MNAIAQALDHAVVRFSISGTLITLYMLAELFARRRRAARWAPPPPRWVHPLVGLSVTAFYLLIAPTGGALFGGFGNLAGAAFALAACGLRFARDVRYPEIAGRCLLYVALPLAVGVPWGLAVLSLPAAATSIWCARRADRLIAAGAVRAESAIPPYRFLPRIW